MVRALPRLLAVLAVLLGTVPFAPAAGAEPGGPALTWAVQPADRHGPDGRRWIEHTLDPGEVLTEHLAVRNFSDAAVVFSLKAADGYLTDRGRFNMLPSDRPSVDGGTWIGVQPQVRVGAGATKVVPFTVTVPRDATPGDHPAGIAATVTSAGGTVAVESRVGFRVMTRVSGTIAASLAVDGLTVGYRYSWNPFAAGTVLVRYTGTNDGNVAVTGTGTVATAGLFGLGERAARADAGELLPGGGREVEVRVGKVWALGPLRTSVRLTPAVLGGDPAGAEIRPGSATVTAWALPWPQLALAALLAAVLLTSRTLLRRRRRRLAELLDRARAEGRASALVGGSGAATGKGASAAG
ncbi:hypothetical protein [Plantactinospora sp. BB1]|uniref:COG1470 family protein n=1 Tax=Plantactinospora sp. BB1 TaxID=2071627 RepID=UPI00131F3F16|nr:hypothetical protein [Plantactinospora sp. BB1]